LIQQSDKTAADIVEHQRDALLERKEVAQKTKDFRKLDDSSKLTEYKSLLKAYQTFIDLLTTHGKESSSAFLQLYTPLSDAPDPFPLLEASVESLVLSEDTLPKLTTENEELQRRVTKLTSQLEETEGRLQRESKARKEAEEGTGARTEEIEAKWAKVLEEKESNWKAKEQALEEKVENQDRLLRELKASYEVSQRLGQDVDGSNTVSDRAAAAELEMMSSDLEKTSARLGEIEARNEQLRVELARLTSHNNSIQSVEEDPAFLHLRNENSSLLRKLLSARFDKDTEKREWDNRVRQTERQRSSLAAENQELRAKMDKCSDYDELKRELDMLKSIELSTGDDDEGELPANGSVDAPKKESLEQLLLARNKKLSDDLTLYRVALQDLKVQHSQLLEEQTSTNAELEKSRQLSSTLENDLSRMQEEAANIIPSSAMSVAGTYTSRYPQSSRRGRAASPTSSIISGYDTHRSLGTTSLEALRSGEPVGGGSGILPMIQAQRDRFKAKNQQLEDELSKTYATVTSLRSEVASLQKDNLNLYEKTRYVSAYSRTGGTTSSSYAQSQPSHTSILSASTPSDNLYETQYESSISPFAAFRGREAARAYSRMSLPERMIFSLTRIVLATRTSRNLFAGYCAGLHVLVFVMLYYMGVGEAKPAVVAGLGSAAVGAVTKQAGDAAKWRQEGFG